jgi:hypothetical protein
MLVGLLPTQQGDIDPQYADYLASLPDGPGKTNGVAVGEENATIILERRANDGRDQNPQFVQPSTGPGVFEPDSRPLLGLRLSRIRPLALHDPWQFRPDGPNALNTQEYADDFTQVQALGRGDSVFRTPEETASALFWTDHDLRRWNEGIHRVAAARRLGLVETARMLAMPHVSGADAMIACFDAKFHSTRGRTTGPRPPRAPRIPCRPRI